MINIISLWNEALSILSARLQAISFEVWIEKLEPVCFVQNKLVLLTNSVNSKTTIEKKYLSTVIEAVKEVYPVITDVIIITESQKDKYLKEQDYIVEGEVVIVDKPKKKEQGFSFSKKYTFESFVVGKSNELAYAAARAVAESPGSKYNPLLLYGGVGLGKTHLMHSIGNYIQQNFQGLRILYTTAEKFTNDYVDSITNKTTVEFREKYRGVDVLMIDDIQFWSRSPGSQEAIFHIFDDLFQNNKHIIISSDRSPKEISHLQDRLVTRFAWGLQEIIKPPDLETRVAILKRKAMEENFYLTDDISYFIAENCENNVRDMEGLLNKIIFYSSLNGAPVTTLEVAKEALRDYIKLNKESIDANDIIEATCQYFNISKDDLVGKRRNKEVVEPRMIAIYLIRDMLNIPLENIGSLFGGRDHSTIINARDKVATLLKTDVKTQVNITDIKALLFRR